jgi:hypothetical protein
MLEECFANFLGGDVPGEVDAEDLGAERSRQSS